MNTLLLYTLQAADNALILGHRLSEWCGHGPVLEQDIAVSNIALDHLGQARNLYQYAAEIVNQVGQNDRVELFSSVALQQKIHTGTVLDEDDLAYLRDGWDFHNLLLVELPNRDWAYTVARSFFFDTYNYLFFSALQNSNNTALSAIAERSLKEVAYHRRWSSEWVIRLGDGTSYSHQKMQEALNQLWTYTGEMFKETEADRAAAISGAGAGLAVMQTAWQEHIRQVIEEATLQMPAGSWMQEGGKQGVHSEHLGYILAEMQFMQRTYPNMQW